MRFLVSAAFLVFLPGVATAFWNLCVRLVHTEKLLLPIAVGVVAGIVVERILVRRFHRVSIFEHELTHAVAALLFLRPVHEFRVTHDGGYVQHGGGFGGGFGGEFANDFIGFAPYVLPTFTAVSVLARPFLTPPWFPWFDAWVGLTLGYDTLGTAREVRSNWHKGHFLRAGTGASVQSDIGSRGYVYSAIYISTATLASHGVLFSIVLRGYHGVPVWGRAVWTVTRHLGAAAARL